MKSCWHRPCEQLNFVKPILIRNLTDLTSSTTQIQTERTILTWEQLIHGIALVFAAILRFGNLGHTPLSPAEAENAWGVWQFWQPAVSDRLPEVGSAAWFSLTTLLTQVLGDSDLVMRLVPALAGIGALLAISYFRPFTGRMGLVVAAFLLALSPLFVSASRTANGNSLALLALIMTGGLWLKHRQAEDNRSLAWLVGWVAFGLTTAPIFFSGLAAFGFAWLLESRLGPPLNLGGSWPQEGQRRQLAIIFVAVLVGGSTMLLLNPAGFGMTANGLESWISAFGGFSNLAVLGDPILVLAQYELFFMVMAIASLLILSFLRDTITSFLGYWLMGSVIMMILQVGAVENALVALIPAALIVGRAFDLTLAQIPLRNLLSTYPDGGMGLPLAGISTVLLLIATTNLGRFTRLGIDASSGQAHYFLFLVCILLVLAIVITVLIYDRLSAVTGLLLIGLLASSVYGWGVAWRLGGDHANDTREQWVQSGTDSELRLLVDTLNETGSSALGLQQSIQIYSTIDNSVLRWYLRDFEDVSFFDAVPAEATPDVVITADNVELQAGSTYTGTDFGITRPDQRLRLNFMEGLRWWFFGDSAPQLTDQRLILWVRTDLITN